MLNTKAFCVFDFETAGKDPNTCEPVEFAAKMYRANTLEPYENGEFHSGMRPDPALCDMDTVRWHAKNQNKTPEEILAEWDKYPARVDVWKDFQKFAKGFTFGKGNSTYNAPIACGYNILGFDMPIVDRLCRECKFIDAKEGKQNIFHRRDVCDIMHLMFYWFEGADAVSNLKLDTFREYFGMPSLAAHTALYDVRQEGELLMRFLKFHRAKFKTSKFKNSFAAKPE